MSNCLLDRIENPLLQPRKICLLTDLVVRNSCRALNNREWRLRRGLPKGPGTEGKINRLTVKKGDEK